MIKERYCSYKISKLLRKKGFDEPCRAYWWDERDVLAFCDFPKTTEDLQYKDNQCLAPTHQMAMDWLREKGFYIEIQTLFDEFEPSLLKFTNFHALITTIIDDRVIDETHLADEGIRDYGECVEFAINYCLTELVKGGEE